MPELRSPSQCYAETLRLNIEAGVNPTEAARLARFSGLYASFLSMKNPSDLDALPRRGTWAFSSSGKPLYGSAPDVEPIATAVELGGEALLEINS